MNFDLTNFSWIITIIGILTLVTNIITEVIKKTLFDKSNFPIQIVATIISLVLTIITYFAYISITETEIVWYAVAGSIILGFFVSYSAQFGFDKLKEIINKYTKG